MGRFKSIKECIASIVDAMEYGWCLVSADFKQIYTRGDELPKQLSGTYVLFRSWNYRIIEIADGVCTYIDDDDPRHSDGSALCKELDEHKMDIICGYYENHGAERHEGRRFVDLGLPSGLKWATEDISSCSPSLFAWGEVKTKSTYTPKNALKRTKFAEIKADPRMDAARVLWGGKWRMPSAEDYQELISVCKWKKRGYGYDVTGPNGNSIFFFSKSWFGEVCRQDGKDNGMGYWTCESKEGEDKAACFRIGDDIREISWVDSYKALFVRPVFSDEDSEHKETFRNNPNAEEFCKGVVEVDGKYTERFVYVGERSHKGGKRATARGYIKTGDIVDITFLGASEEPICITVWNPVWETDEQIPYMGENYFFEVLVNGTKRYIGKYESYRQTKDSRMGGCLEPKIERTGITKDTVVRSFKDFKDWLCEGANTKKDWNFLKKPSDVEFPVPDGLPVYQVNGNEV